MGGTVNPRYANGHRRRMVRARVLGQGRPCWICGLPIDPSLPNLDPCQGVVDEALPVSQGGSPYQGGNCLPAHRCCNAWRSTKPVAVVREVQSAIASMGGATTPQQCCAMARAVLAAIRRDKAIGLPQQVEQSTDW